MLACCGALGVMWGVWGVSWVTGACLLCGAVVEALALVLPWLVGCLVGWLAVVLLFLWWCCSCECCVLCCVLSERAHTHKANAHAQRERARAQRVRVVCAFSLYVCRVRVRARSVCVRVLARSLCERARAAVRACVRAQDRHSDLTPRCRSSPRSFLREFHSALWRVVLRKRRNSWWKCPRSRPSVLFSSRLRGANR